MSFELLSHFCPWFHKVLLYIYCNFFFQKQTWQSPGSELVRKKFSSEDLRCLTRLQRCALVMTFLLKKRLHFSHHSRSLFLHFSDFFFSIAPGISARVKKTGVGIWWRFISCIFKCTHFVSKIRDIILKSKLNRQSINSAIDLIGLNMFFQ